MKEYKFYVLLHEATDGAICVEANNYDEAYDKAVEEVQKATTDLPFSFEFELETNDDDDDDDDDYEDEYDWCCS